MSNAPDFIIENGVLKKYVGPGGDVVIPDGVTAISASAFSGNKEIYKVTLPDTVEKIGKEAFCQSSLEKIKLPEGLKTIGESAFKWSKLSEIVIPSSISAIGKSAFWGCGRLERVILPEGLKTVKAYAFEDCGSLKEIVIPSTVRSVEEDAFWGCKSLAYLQLPEKLTKFQKVFGEILKTPLIAPGIALKDIPSGYKKNVVKGFALAYRFGVAYPATIEAEYIAYIKKQKKSLYELACWNVDLLRFMIDEKIIPIKDVEGLLDQADVVNKALLLEYQNASEMSNNTKKKSNITEFALEDKPKTAAELKKEWKTKKLADGTLMLTAYKGNDTVVQIPNLIGKASVTVIGEDALCAEDWRIGREQADKCVKITDVIIPDGITEIQKNAFAMCANLKTVTISETVTVIGGNAFLRCTSLESVVLHSGISAVGRNAFYGCSALQEAKIPASVKEINEGMISVCKNLQRLVIEDGVERIGLYAFAFCENLAYIRIPQTVTEISPMAFHDCKKCVIHAPAGSYAETYAKENSIPFVAE